eukprot:4308538-Amphidinium_carterae.1
MRLLRTGCDAHFALEQPMKAAARVKNREGSIVLPSLEAVSSRNRALLGNKMCYCAANPQIKT